MINEIAPHIFNNTFEGSREVKEDDFILCYRENLILLKDSGDQSEIPIYQDIKDISELNLRYLFCLNSNNCFLLDEFPSEAGHLVFKDSWSLRSFNKKEQAWIGAVGFQLKTWYENNKFCGRCGATCLRTLLPSAFRVK
jgi:NAD+ diphosphatase